MTYTASTSTGLARKPKTKIPDLPENLAHLHNEPHCVLWKYGSEKNGKGKYPKEPHTPHKERTAQKRNGTYRKAATDNPASWGTYDQCVAAIKDWPTWFDGIGFVLQPGEIGGDLDDCVN